MSARSYDERIVPSHVGSDFEVNEISLRRPKLCYTVMGGENTLVRQLVVSYNDRLSIHARKA